jgi:SNF2 family DNA or RNA helicase
MEALLEILQENPTGRFLIFSRYDSPLESIQEQIIGNYPSHTLQGNKDSIAKTLAEFEKGNIRILLMNSQTSAAGLNIPSATHLILLHKMAAEEEKQILGRAYRLGRTTPLQYIKLLHQKE